MGAQKERQGLAMELNINGELTKCRFAEPNQSQVFELDKFFRRVFAECVREGMMTEAEAAKRYEESGAWTKEDDKKIQNLLEQVSLNSVLLTAETELSEDAATLIEKIQESRNSMLELLSRKTDLFSNTAEGMANEQRIYKFVTLCLVEEDGMVLFGSDAELEAFSQNNKEDFETVMRAAYALTYGVDSEKDITEDYAEVQFLQMLSEKPLEEAEEASEE